MSSEEPRPPHSVFALNPEKEIERLAYYRHKIERQQKIDSAFHGNMALLGVVSATASTVDAVTKSGDDRARALDNVDASMALTGAALHADSVSRDLQDFKLGDLARKREPWERYCLRRTTLEPGDAYGGKVIFRLDASNCRRIVLKIPLGKITVTFPFKPLT